MISKNDHCVVTESKTNFTLICHVTLGKGYPKFAPFLLS